MVERRPGPLHSLVTLLALVLVLGGCSGLSLGARSLSSSSATTGPATPVASPAAAPATPDANAVPPAGGSRIVEGGLAEPRTLNPLFVSDPISDQLSHLVFSGLVAADPVTGQPDPDLAKSWDTSSDGLSYTFHLRDGVLWQDTQPFGAQDVLFTYQTMMNEKVRSPRYSRLVSRIRRVSAPDASTVRFDLAQPDASFLTSLATLGIVPQHLLADVLPEELVTNPFGLSTAVGTGPFTLGQWARGEEIVFPRNPRYFKGEVGADQYVYRVLGGPQDVVAGLRDGSVDWAELDPTTVAAAQQIPGISVDALPGFDLTYVALQLDPAKSRLFLDPGVRQALLLALDRTTEVASIWTGHARVADGTIPPASWAYASSKATYRQDLLQAGKLLDAAGWKVGSDGVRARDGVAFRFTLTTNGDDPVHRQLAEWLVRSWRAIGIDVQANDEQWSSVRNRLTTTHVFDALLLTYRWGVDPDPSALWSSGAFLGGLNVGHYASATVDDLLGKGLATRDAKARATVYGQVQDEVMRDLPVLPLAFPDLVVARSQRLHDVRLTAILVRNRANIEQWIPGKGS